MINAVSSSNINSPQPSSFGGGDNSMGFTPSPAPSNPVVSVPSASTGDNSGNKTNKRKSKHFSPKMVLGGLLMLLLIVGGVAGFILMNSSQDTRNQASEPIDVYACSSPLDCPAGYVCGMSGNCIIRPTTVSCNPTTHNCGTSPMTRYIEK